MSETKASHSPEDTYVLVTGANSGLGYSICRRLANEFLKTRPQSSCLNIIFTTRSARKAQDTTRRLEADLRKIAPSPADFSRVRFLPESVDLGSLVSVRACSRRLNSTFPKLDAIILNAGIGGWSGIDWLAAVWGVCTDLLYQVTWPTYKVAPVGVLTEKQISSKEPQEPALGSVFCANVFGHYMLAHNVAPLLKRAKAPDGPGRVIWVSSIEGTVKFFDMQDIQGLRNTTPYESSKALTDVLALTSDLPSTAPWAVDSYFGSDDADKEKSGMPTIHVAHPGICATAIVPLPLPLIWAMVITFWVARMLGSPWHTMSTYLGANSPVFLALSSKAELDAAEEPYRRAGGGKPKWGSSASRCGAGNVICTETDGWGYGGVVGAPVVEADRQRLRKRGAVDLTAEQREKFEQLGRQCWKEMEELRIKWDAILDEAEKTQNDQ
ncbi:uncharacterized protein N7484_011455 [Penicillium longicatenatum]|uniref:uncharacterized protein n=1 Tax=Penicillium longicatenatum TaxID=1561947 RepID=UPI0025478302|nr:uncharacterized protein N7484_011455 [Penicillium longicatenatum]KAJ5631355.1 hypothetical protein N7484_011455 [Penicillium longicatenatum]